MNGEADPMKRQPLLVIKTGRFDKTSGFFHQ